MGVASAAYPSVSFSLDTYACGGSIQINYNNANNSEIYLFSLDAYGEPIWSGSGYYGSGSELPGLNLSSGRYIVEIRNTDGSIYDFDDMTISSCGGGGGGGTGDGGGGTGTGDGGGSGGTGDGGGGGGGSDDANPFTPPDAYDSSVPGQEWKTWIDLNADGITSYAESVAAFRYWGFMFLFLSIGLAACKFVAKVKLW